MVIIQLHIAMPNPPTNIVDFREFDSSIILFLRDGIPRPIGDFPESLSPAMLVGIMLVGRLGAHSATEVAKKAIGDHSPDDAPADGDFYLSL